MEAQSVKAMPVRSASLMTSTEELEDCVGGTGNNLLAEGDEKCSLNWKARRSLAPDGEWGCEVGSANREQRMFALKEKTRNTKLFCM
jgi:hypothetical protein